MAQADDAMPSNTAIRQALRETTQRLVHEVTAPDTRAPEWSDVEWRIAMAASAMHGISGLLQGRLRWLGPPLWQGFLSEQRQQTLLRQERIAALLARLDDAGRDAGVPIVALKGSALLALGAFADGERPMGDVDLLVRPQDRERMLRVLHAMGHVVEHESPRHVSLRPARETPRVAFGEHVGNPIRIELHERIYESLPLREVDITSLLIGREAHPGINAYPTMATLMRHLLLHAAGNVCAMTLRFIQLHDIAHLASRLDASDWDELLAQDGNARSLWWAYPPLMLASRHFPDAIPASVLQGVERSSRPLLRRPLCRWTLVDVSMSAARVPALPGLWWSASPAEAMTLMRRRLFPPSQVYAHRRYYASTPFANALPGWSQASQAGRIVRWILQRPPTAPTMHSIGLALAYRPADAAWSASNKAAV